jgi:hypothetical protein
MFSLGELPGRAEARQEIRDYLTGLQGEASDTVRRPTP